MRNRYQRTGAAAFALVASFIVGAAAQPPQTTTGGTMAGEKVTVTGCLAAPDAAATTTANPDTGDRGMMANAYRLTNATTGASTTTAAGATTASTGTSGAAAGTPASYMLMGEESTLKPHVGHKIEVTGTLAAGGRRGGADAGATTAAGTSTAGGTPTTGETTAAAGATAGQGRGMGGGRGRALRVESVKMLSPSCP